MDPEKATITGAVDSIAAIIAGLARKESRSSAVYQLRSMFCDVCGGRHDDEALALPRQDRCDCVIWADE